jgi:predicted nucleic acid-binding protein
MVDSSALYALLRAEDARCQDMFDVLRDEPCRVVSPYVVAEVDYLFLTRYGIREELLVLDELASGNYELPSMGPADVLACARVIARYDDHEIGIADASLVVLADRYGTNRICTLDRRHFSILRTLDGAPFELLP